jgi:hypothetical protein
MKRMALVLAVAMICMGFSGLMLAQENPVVGTWKLNLEKSKFPSGMAPKSMTRTVSADGDKVKYSFEGEGHDGKALNYSFTVTYDGKDNEVAGSGMPYGADHIAIKRLSSHKFSSTLKKDGKTTTIISKGKDTSGKEVSSTSVYDRQ